ncbi:MAG: hypothetical protein V7742_09695 [Halioglobus sp.]
MEIFDVLVLGVEAGIALAGFAGIIATFQFGGAKGIRRGDAVGLTMVVRDSLTAAAVCSLAMLLLAFQISESATWALTSLFASAVILYGIYSNARLVRHSFKRKSFLLFWAFGNAVGALVVLANILNAADVVFHREPGPALMAATLGMSLSAYSFSRLLLLPIWRAVRSAEAATSQAPA